MDLAKSATWRAGCSEQPRSSPGLPRYPSTFATFARILYEALIAAQIKVPGMTTRPYKPGDRQLDPPRSSATHQNAAAHRAHALANAANANTAA